MIAAVVGHLLELGYLDDRKFACQWAVSRSQLRGFGRRRIEQELKQKGIARETIHEALAEILSPEDEHETARRVAEKKLGTMKNLEPEVRRKRLAGFLERKGFSSDIISSILRTL